jgi:hypothetical protein
MKSKLFIFLSVLILSCKQTTAPTGPNIGEEFDLQYGQTVQIQNKNFTINFKAVAEDSRCPTNVCCKWEGNAKIILHVLQQDTSLNTTLEPKTITFEGENEIHLTVRLISVSPYPITDEQIKLEDYRIRLVVFSDEMF